MSERLAPTEKDPTENVMASPKEQASGMDSRYAVMKVDVGEMGNDFYYSLPTFTILVHTEEELKTLNEEFSAVISKYTDQIVVGTPHETSLIVSINQAAANLAQQSDIIKFLREKIHELTGSYEAAGGWEEPAS